MVRSETIKTRLDRVFIGLRLHTATGRSPAEMVSSRNLKTRLPLVTLTFRQMSMAKRSEAGS